MSTLMEELTAIKDVEDKLTANKVANFAYTDHAYNNPLTEADGVESYDADAEQNIPLANASVLNVNSTVLTKGWRAQASSITRMLMNHFLGRCSYNLNKINDLFSAFLTKLMAYMGEPNGLATLDEDGYVYKTQLSLSKGDIGLGNVVNTGDSATPTEDGTDKFTTGGAYALAQSIAQSISECAPKNHASSSDQYGVASTQNFGHVKIDPATLLWEKTITDDVTFFSGITFPRVPKIIKNADPSAHLVTITAGGSFSQLSASNTYWGVMLGTSYTLDTKTLTMQPGTTSTIMFTIPAGGILLIFESIIADEELIGVSTH